MASLVFTIFQHLFVAIVLLAVYQDFDNANASVDGKRLNRPLKNPTFGNLMCEGQELSLDNNTKLNFSRRCKQNMKSMPRDLRIFKRSAFESQRDLAVEGVTSNDSTVAEQTNFTPPIGRTTTADYPTTSKVPDKEVNHSYLVGALAVGLGATLFSICIYCIYIRLRNPASYTSDPTRERTNEMELATIQASPTI